MPLAVGNSELAVVVTGAGGITQTYQIAVAVCQPRLLLRRRHHRASHRRRVLAERAHGKPGVTFAPTPGANLTMLRNTGTDPIRGVFANLAQGQVVALAFGGINYPFVANYSGGDGNDLTLEWANNGCWHGATTTTANWATAAPRPAWCPRRC